MWMLLAANLVPLACVPWLGWRAADLVFLYWLETVLMVAFGTAGLFLAGISWMKSTLQEAFFGSLLVAAIFGVFCYIMGQAVLSLFQATEGAPLRLGLAQLVRELLRNQPAIFAAALVIAASQAFAVAENLFADRTKRAAGAFKPFWQVPVRMVVVLLVAAPVALVVGKRGNPVWGVALLVVPKTWFEYLCYRAARKSFEETDPAKSDRSTD